VSQPRFELGTSRIRVKCVTASANFLVEISGFHCGTMRMTGRWASLQSGRKVPTFSEALPASLTKEAVETVKRRYIFTIDSTVSHSKRQ